MTERRFPTLPRLGSLLAVCALGALKIEALQGFVAALEGVIASAGSRQPAGVA